MKNNRVFPIYILIWTEDLKPIFPYFELIESAMEIAIDPDYIEDNF